MLDKFLDYIRIAKSGNTLKTYTTALHALFPSGYNEPTREWLLAWLEQNQKKLSRNTIKNRLTVLAKFIRFHKLPMADTIEICEGYKGERKLKPSPTLVDVQDILERVQGNPKHTAIFYIAVVGGLRVSEIVTLDITDVLDRAVIVRDTKNKKDRLVTLSEHAWQALQKSLETRENTSPALFTTRNGRMSVRAIQAVIERVRNFLGIDCSMHSLRHFCATQMDRTGASPVDIAAKLGHTGLGQVMTYVSASHGRQREFTNKAFEAI